MKGKKIIAMLLLFTLVTSFTSIVSATGYSDVENGDWYYEAVTSLSEEGIVDGYPDGSFLPDQTLTVAHFLKMIGMALYPDLLLQSDQAWDRGSYNAALEKGVISASEINESQINQPICRYNAALIVSHVLERVMKEEIAVPDGMVGYIRDHFSIPSFYLDFVYKAYAAGVLGGYGDDTFRGQEGLTRAEGAEILLRLRYPGSRLMINSAKLSVEVDDEWFSDAAFIGDSLTHGLSLYGGLKTPDYYYSTGVSLYSVNTAEFETPSGPDTKLCDALTKNRYGKIYILLGINQLGSNTDRYYADYAALIDTIRAYQPEAEIYLQSILPVSRVKDAGSTVFTKDRVLLFNEVIKKLAIEKNTKYVNIHERFADENGFLPAEKTWDGVHLNSVCYEDWVGYLKTHT
jgi:hypothetical protein